jgi:broad specificity phosphatase PhoE
MAKDEVRRLVVELVPHADAGDWHTWSGNQDARPLSALGRQQAKVLTEELSHEPVDALFASPALRARQTLEPLAEMIAKDVRIADDLSEKLFGEDTTTMAERGFQALRRIRQDCPSGRAIACSHGDMIPALAELLASRWGVAVDSLEHRGQRYVVQLEGSSGRIELREIAEFPR